MLERFPATAQDGVPGGWYPGFGHQRLRVHLRALETSRLGAWTEGGDPLGLECVDQPVDERRLGPDDDEVDCLGPGGVDDRGDRAVGRDHPCVLGDPGVAWGAEQLWGARRARQCAHDRVLATARADDENPGAVLAHNRWEFASLRCEFASLTARR